jgi:hypothetical protein
MRDYPYPLLNDAQQLDRLACRELRDRDYPRRRPRQAPQQQPAVAARPSVECLGVAEHREVVNGDDERRGGEQRAAVAGEVQHVVLPAREGQCA